MGFIPGKFRHRSSGSDGSGSGGPEHQRMRIVSEDLSAEYDDVDVDHDQTSGKYVQSDDRGHLDHADRVMMEQIVSHWPESRKSSRAALIYHEVVHELGQLRRPRTSAKVALLAVFIGQFVLSILMVINGMNLLCDQEHQLLENLSSGPMSNELNNDTQSEKDPQLDASREILNHLSEEFASEDLLEKSEQVATAYILTRVFFLALWILVQGIELCGFVGVILEAHTLIYIHVIMSAIGLIFTVFIPFDHNSPAAIVQVTWLIMCILKIVSCLLFIRSMQVRKRARRGRENQAAIHSQRSSIYCPSRRMTTTSLNHSHHVSHQHTLMTMPPLACPIGLVGPSSPNSSPTHSITTSATYTSNGSSYTHRPSYFYTINEMM